MDDVNYFETDLKRQVLSETRATDSTATGKFVQKQEHSLELSSLTRNVGFKYDKDIWGFCSDIADISCFLGCSVVLLGLEFWTFRKAVFYLLHGKSAREDFFPTDDDNKTIRNVGHPKPNETTKHCRRPIFCIAHP